MGSGAVPGFYWRRGLALARRDKREIIIRAAEAWQPLLETAERHTERYVKDWPCHRLRHLLTDSGIWSLTWRWRTCCNRQMDACMADFWWNKGFISGTRSCKIMFNTFITSLCFLLHVPLTSPSSKTEFVSPKVQSVIEKCNSRYEQNILSGKIFLYVTINQFKTIMNKVMCKDQKDESNI